MSAKPEHKREVILSGKSVAIATPSYGNALTANYHISLTQSIPELLRYGITYSLITITRDAILSKARNWLVKEFLKTSCDYILFVDSDMEWTPDAILRLLSMEVDFCGVPGPRKSDEPSFCANPCANEDGTIPGVPELGLYECSEIGTGFVLIHRSVFEKIKKSNPNNWYYDPHTREETYRYFEELIEDHEFWSEDYTFCKKWTRTGGKIYFDPAVELGHVGEKLFKGKMLDILQKKESDVSQS